MTIGRAFAVSLMGVEGDLVECEADLADGLPGLTIVGLPDASLSEARDRVKSAINNSGCQWPQRRITLALLPATLPKTGSAYDLPIAIAILAANRIVPESAAMSRVLIGELGLDGRLRAIRGVLPMVLAATRAGIWQFVVPAANAAEARLVPDVDVVGAANLREVLDFFVNGIVPDEADVVEPELDDLGQISLDLSQVGGQARARRAIEVAAAGGHHIFMLGAPGAGKTMLAERLPGLLPDLPSSWAMEVSAIHSVAGLLPAGEPLVTRPPFRAPHHTASKVSLIGGGSGVLRPGEISCAHRGVLFLDEAPEFAPSNLDSLRQPLESGVIRISRARGTVAFPARVILVLAANPCACVGASAATNACICTPNARRRYLSRLSGPLLDRVDLRIQVDPVSRADLMGDVIAAESSALVADRVAGARAVARDRLRGTPWRVMGDVPSHELRRRWPLSPATMAAALKFLDQGQLSARGLDRVMRVAWTLSDLAGRSAPGQVEVGEALSLRIEAAA